MPTQSSRPVLTIFQGEFHLKFLWSSGPLYELYVDKYIIENHYMSLIKTSLLIQREISLQIYFFGIVYFFRYVQISSIVENDCAYTMDSFSFFGGRGYFQLCEFQQLCRNNQFIKYKSFYVQFFNSRFLIS